jgi:hypothetical protein
MLTRASLFSMATTPARHPGHQGIVGAPVEKFRQVHVYGYLEARFDVALYLLDGVVGGAPGPTAKTRRREVRVEERAQPLRDRLLDYPIDDGRNPQQPFPLPVPLRYFRASDRGGLIGISARISCKSGKRRGILHG